MFPSYAVSFTKRFSKQRRNSDKTRKKTKELCVSKPNPGTTADAMLHGEFNTIAPRSRESFGLNGGVDKSARCN